MKDQMFTTVRIFNFVIGIFLILGISIYAVNMYSRYLEKPFLSYKNLPFPITAIAFPGDTVEFVLVRCNSSNEIRDLVSTRALVPEDPSMRAIERDHVYVSVKPGCTPPVKIPVVIPIDTKPGSYRYVGVSTVKGLISEHEVKWNTDIVHVVEKPE